MVFESAGELALGSADETEGGRGVQACRPPRVLAKRRTLRGLRRYIRVISARIGQVALMSTATSTQHTWLKSTLIRRSSINTLFILKYASSQLDSVSNPINP